MSFALNSRLAADTILVGELPLSQLRLMDDQRFLWLVLVPRKADVCEIIDLDARERGALMEEIADVSTFLRARGAEKINIGALGNIVRQLHVHVVARVVGDEAWPGPVWGAGEAVPYEKGFGEGLAREIAEGLGPAGLGGNL